MCESKETENYEFFPVEVYCKQGLCLPALEKAVSCFRTSLAPVAEGLQQGTMGDSEAA